MASLTFSQYMIIVLIALTPVIVFGTLFITDKIARFAKMSAGAAMVFQVLSYIVEAVIIGFTTYHAF